MVKTSRLEKKNFFSNVLIKNYLEKLEKFDKYRLYHKDQIMSIKSSLLYKIVTLYICRAHSSTSQIDYFSQNSLKPENQEVKKQVSKYRVLNNLFLYLQSFIQCCYFHCISRLCICISSIFISLSIIAKSTASKGVQPEKFCVRLNS